LLLSFDFLRGFLLTDKAYKNLHFLRFCFALPIRFYVVTYFLMVTDNYSLGVKGLYIFYWRNCKSSF